MRSRLLLASAAIASAVAAPALAQTAWSGPYFGAAVGYAKQADKGSETTQFDTNLDGRFGDTVNTAAGANAFSPGFCGAAANGATPAAGCNEDDNSLEGAIRAGYDWQLGSWVVGGVAELGAADVEDSVGAFSTTPAGYTMKRKLRGMAAVRARVGYPVGSYLPYVTAGFARAKVNSSFSTTNTVNTFVQSGDEGVSGFQLGAGVERELVPSVRLGLEYLFTRLDDDSYRVRAQGPAPATNPFILVNAAGTDFRRSNNDFDIHAVRATVAYAF
ncbi:MAG: hypothetical protein BGN86_07990 [Caulobacterales bacterium 68-7]|nr:MAG: hypothetical protein BGN86_07990 [Caulobacterales bacterium 68-7]